jgi:hypothetical protein
MRIHDILSEATSNSIIIMNEIFTSTLDTLFDAMALGDTFLGDVAKAAVLSGLTNDPETILYRLFLLPAATPAPVP